MGATGWYKRRVLVLFALAFVTAAIVIGITICTVVALYETLNAADDRTLRLDASAAAGVARELAAETLAALACVITLPLGWRSGRPRPAAPGRSLPIVLVPGWAVGRGSLALLQARLRRDGWPQVTTVRRAPLGADLHQRARALAATVDDVGRASGAPRVMLVAHGVGGIVCRIYLRFLGGLPRVAKMVTLASPHQGSKLFVLASVAALHDVRAGAPLLDELATDDPIPDAVDCTAIRATFDPFVVPATLAFYPRAANIEVEGAGHLSMLWSGRVYALVRENLAYVPESAAVASASTQRATSSSSQ